MHVGDSKLVPALSLSANAQVTMIQLFVELSSNRDCVVLSTQ